MARRLTGTDRIQVIQESGRAVNGVVGSVTLEKQSSSVKQPENTSSSGVTFGSWGDDDVCEVVLMVVRGMDGQIKDMVRSCDIFLENTENPVRSILHPWEKATRPWSRIHIEHACPFLKDQFLIVVDSFSMGGCLLSIKHIGEPNNREITAIIYGTWLTISDCE